MPPAAVLFDLDGTLAHSQECWFSLVQSASAHFGGHVVTRAAFEASFGQSAAADAAQFFPKAEAAQVERFYDEKMVRHIHSVTANPHAFFVLQRLQVLGIPTACVTNSPREFTQAVLSACGLRPWLRTVATASDVAVPKPSPEMIYLACRNLDVDVTQCVMVGDSTFDVVAARAAGCRVLGLGVPADRTLANLGEVLDFI